MDPQTTVHPARPARAGLTRWIAIAAAVVVADQMTKLVFDATLRYGQRINLLPFFDFTLLYNTGAAFSFLADAAGWQRWLFTLLGAGAAIVIVMLMRSHRTEPRFLAALALILGGALGNVVDRVAYGHVIDFLLFYWGDWYFPAFNLADTAITLGAMLLILDEFLKMRGSHARPS